jgi:hypothetical protein
VWISCCPWLHRKSCCLGIILALEMETLVWPWPTFPKKILAALQQREPFTLCWLCVLALEYANAFRGCAGPFVFGRHVPPRSSSCWFWE